MHPKENAVPLQSRGDNLAGARNQLGALLRDEPKVVTSFEKCATLDVAEHCFAAVRAFNAYLTLSIWATATRDAASPAAERRRG